MQILLAEDDAVTSAKLEQLLVKWGYDVVVVSDGEDAWEVLQKEDGPRLALLDWMMPMMDGIELCRRLRSTPDLRYVYAVLLTQKSKRGDLIAGLSAGADDYLVKPVDPAELYARLHSGKRVLKVQAQLVAMQETLEHQALYDSLTKTLNRRAGLQMLERELERSIRNEKPLAVAMCDLDQFKSINDTWGHVAGDAVIEAACTRMASVIRIYDFLSRHGGEEFLLVLPDAGKQDAVGILERCRAALAAEPVGTQGVEIPITASFGLCVAESAKGLAPADLIGAADAALYRAKRAGRNRVEVGDAPVPGEPSAA